MASPATAQDKGADPDLVYPTDAYGNVQPVDQTWRPLGIPMNEFERDALGYQALSRRFGQRSGLEPFALPGDVWSVSRMTAMGTDVSPTIRSRLTPRKRMAFERYGGFAPRRQGMEPDPQEMFSRRFGLIAANALNAPVYRAMARTNAMVDLQSSIVQTPFLTEEVETPDESTPTLAEQLDVTDRLAYGRVRTEAWKLFNEGQYRAAMRTFETAITLEPDDYESRIGEIFAYLAIGGRRTAVALLGELVRRDENPFLHALNMRARFGNAADANALQIQARLAADDEDQRPDVNALYILVLWHLGVEEDALRTAEWLARREPAKPYALWPEKMRAAQSAAKTPPIEQP